MQIMPKCAITISLPPICILLLSEVILHMNNEQWCDMSVIPHTHNVVILPLSTLHHHKKHAHKYRWDTLKWLVLWLLWWFNRKLCRGGAYLQPIFVKTNMIVYATTKDYFICHLILEVKHALLLYYSQSLFQLIWGYLIDYVCIILHDQLNYLTLILFLSLSLLYSSTILVNCTRRLKRNVGWPGQHPLPCFWISTAHYIMEQERFAQSCKNISSHRSIVKWIQVCCCSCQNIFYGLHII